MRKQTIQDCHEKKCPAAYKRKPAIIHKIVFLLALAFCGLGVTADELTDAQWQKLKEQALGRKRAFMYNNDGSDVFFPNGLAVTKENFWNQRLIYAKQAGVDSILYCPLSAGIGYMSTRTKVGNIFLTQPEPSQYHNIVGDLIAKNTDALKLVGEFCRKNNIEFFVSLRCNDTHDTIHRKDAPCPYFPPFKKAHPEYLMGKGSDVKYSRWSAVDFTHKGVRDYFLALIREVLTDYELDGIELDFCRHLYYFKSVAVGREASAADLKKMNDCMREVRKMAEAIGRARKRPILIAVRVPDSLEYAKAVGLDVETWLKEKLIDIMIGGFYMRLNRWKDTADICHKYGVKFYPSLDESRIMNAHPAFRRNTTQSVNARIAAALKCGVDGIYFFNREKSALTNPANAANIKFADKRYFITYRYVSPLIYVASGQKYEKLRNLSPLNKVILRRGKPEKFNLEFGDDLSAPEVLARKPQLATYIRARMGMVDLRVNGHKAKVFAADPSVSTPKGGTILYNVPMSLMKPGNNEITLSVNPAGGKPGPLEVMKGNALLVWGKNQVPWRRLFDTHDDKNSEKVVDGAYRIADTGTAANQMANLLYPFSSGLYAEYLEVIFKLKVESSSDPLAVALRVADGKNVEIVTFEPKKIGLYYAGRQVEFNTADRFHDYRVAMKDGQTVVTADGKEILRGKLVMKADSKQAKLRQALIKIPFMNTKSVVIGSLSGPGTGAALWKNVCFFSDASRVEVEDMKFELRFPPVKPPAAK
jgi:hypothetical protein